MKKKIVVIGGGNGGAKSIRACKTFIDQIELSAVISVSDSAGSSGRLRKEFNTLPAGDILRAVMAMSKYSYKFLKDIFYKNRFENTGKLDKHNLGNLFLILGEQYSGDFVSAVRALEQSLEAQGQVYPATLDQTDLVVEMQNGDVIKGEGEIDRPDADFGNKIKKAWLDPEGKIYNGAKKVIEEADYILFGPGSLYCSIVATILPVGVKEAIEKSKAKLVYIPGNAYEMTGEAGPEKLSDFVKELQNYLPKKIDHVVHNNCRLNEKQLEWYTEKQWTTFEVDSENIPEYNVVSGCYEEEKFAGLSSDKLGAILQTIIFEK